MGHHHYKVNGQKMARPFSSIIQANHIPPMTDAANQENTETSGFM